MAGGRLTKTQFTSSGSEANDFVVKLVWYYNNALGRPNKKTIVSRQKGYHGVSVASGSLTGMPNFHREFDLPMPFVRHLMAPHFWRNGQPGESEAAFVARLGAEFEALIATEGADTIAAFIGEPVMGAGGVIPPPAGYWPIMQAICRKHDILIIADEVITGFGRTGELFGSHKYGIEPDIMVVSKALTSSYFPLSAVMISDAIYQAVADNSAKIGTFAHGFTASGHPVGTAVAMENLDILEEKGLVARAQSSRRISRAGCRSSRPIRWSARRGAWGSSARWSWSPTRRPRRPSIRRARSGSSFSTSARPRASSSGRSAK